MTGFAIAAALCAVAAMLFIALPWLRANGPGSRVAPPLAALGAVTLAVALYAHLSTWQWQTKSADKAGASAIAALQRAATDQPQNLDNWLQLGWAYLEIEQFPLARSAFERANRLANGNNADALSGMAEAMVLGGDESNGARAEELFNRALQLDPRSAKALFYTALTALSAGQLQTARDRFATMLTLEAPTDVRTALQKQIAALDVELEAARIKPANVDNRTAVRVTIAVAAALRERFASSAAAGATLFVFVRNPQGGVPLAVKRLSPMLPQKLTLSSADAMIAGNAIQPGQHVQVIARLSASSSTTAQSGDLSGEISYVAGKEGQRELVVSELLP